MSKKLVLKASAGTGKTFRLSLEYIYRLVCGENYEEILVMTFTKKATAEIKNRIFEHLSFIVNKTAEGDSLLEIIEEKYGNIKIDFDNLSKIYFSMLKNKEKVKVYTLDSFTNMIFKKMISPYLNIYSYEIISEKKNDEYIEQILEKLILNNTNFSIFQNFFSIYMEKDIEKYFVYIKNIIDNRWKFEITNYETKFEYKDTNYFPILEEILYKLKEIAIIREKEESYPDLYVNKDFQDYLKINDIKDREKYILDNYSTFLTKKFANGQQTRAKNVKDLKDDIDLLYEEFQSKLSKKVFNKYVIPLEKEMFIFANVIYEIYDGIKFSEKKFTHSDISNYTYLYLYKNDLNLIKSDGIDPYFYDLLDSEIKTIFIDEFQDTSILQWKILFPIIDNSESVICVGDEKQSIYGWRGGEKELFENLEIIIEANEEKMDTSYRSKSKIIDFVNEFFINISDDWSYTKVNSVKEGGYV